MVSISTDLRFYLSGFLSHDEATVEMWASAQRSLCGLFFVNMFALGMENDG